MLNTYKFNFLSFMVDYWIYWASPADSEYTYVVLPHINPYEGDKRVDIIAAHL